jgi:hypothetical protein
VRAGKALDGGTRVMVFSGASEVKAAGAAVNVAAGMGTKVPVSGPPQAPEKLLAAPKFANESLHWNYNNGLIRWAAVPSAVRYTLEVCADRNCEKLALRKTGIAPGADGVNQYQVSGLTAQSYFLRVSAESQSGLDGYPSALGMLQVDRAEADSTGPMLSLQASAGFRQNAAGLWVAGPQARATVSAFDEYSGLSNLRYRYDQEAFKALASGEEIAIRAGELEIVASDALGQVQTVRYRIGAD